MIVDREHKKSKLNSLWYFSVAASIIVNCGYFHLCELFVEELHFIVKLKLL